MQVKLRVGNLLLISNDLNIFERKGRKEGEPLLAIQQWYCIFAKLHYMCTCFLASNFSHLSIAS